MVKVELGRSSLAYGLQQGRAVDLLRQKASRNSTDIEGTNVNLHQRGTFRRNEREERARIGTLLVDLQRSLEMIKGEIDIEERQTQWTSPCDPRYPIIGRALRARHDNLAATIRILEDRAREMMESA